MTRTDPARQYITVADAAKRLRLSRQRVYVLIRAGRIDAVQVGTSAKVWLVNGDNLTIKPPQTHVHIKPEEENNG